MFEKVKREARHSATRLEVGAMPFPRNDRPYGLKCEAFQTENALMLLRGPGKFRESDKRREAPQRDASLFKLCGEIA